MGNAETLGVTLVLTPLYVKTRVLSGLGDGLACAEVCHDALVDLSRKEALKASDDLACGPAIGGAAGDVGAGWLVESPADDDGSIEGGGGLSVAASLEAVPAGGPPGRGRDRARAAARREGGVRTNPVRVIAEDDQQLGRGVGAHTETLTEEVFVTCQGRRQYLWRAVDQDGDVLDILVQSRRDRRAAARFFRKVLKGQSRSPRRLVTDKVSSTTG